MATPKTIRRAQINKNVNINMSGLREESEWERKEEIIKNSFHESLRNSEIVYFHFGIYCQ